MAFEPIDVRHLEKTYELAVTALEEGNQPFGALLAGPSGEVLQTANNRVNDDADVTAHSELSLARWASVNLPEDVRSASTVYTSCEHCAMCAGAHYQTSIGRIVFVLTLQQLAEAWPPGVPILRLGVREVLARGSKPIEVIGPYDPLVEQFQELHRKYWAIQPSPAVQLEG